MQRFQILHFMPIFYNLSLTQIFFLWKKKKFIFIQMTPFHRSDSGWPLEGLLITLIVFHSDRSFQEWIYYHLFQFYYLNSSCSIAISFLSIVFRLGWLRILIIAWKASLALECISSPSLMSIGKIINLESLFALSILYW